jgi:hypothetical protein
VANTNVIVAEPYKSHLIEISNHIFATIAINFTEVYSRHIPVEKKAVSIMAGAQTRESCKPYRIYM